MAGRWGIASSQTQFYMTWIDETASVTITCGDGPTWSKEYCGYFELLGQSKRKPNDFEVWGQEAVYSNWEWAWRTSST